MMEIYYLLLAGIWCCQGNHWNGNFYMKISQIFIFLTLRPPNRLQNRQKARRPYNLPSKHNCATPTKIIQRNEIRNRKIMGNGNWVSHAIDRLAKMNRRLVHIIRMYWSGGQTITYRPSFDNIVLRYHVSSTKWVMLMPFQVQLLHAINGNHISATQ